MLNLRDAEHGAPQPASLAIAAILYVDWNGTEVSVRPLTLINTSTVFNDIEHCCWRPASNQHNFIVLGCDFKACQSIATYGNAYMELNP